MATMRYKSNGKVYNVTRFKAWAVLGWSIAITLAVIMSGGAF